MQSMQPTELPDLLGHAGWLRRLAVSLVRDRDAADDVVQETLVAAWTHPPDQDAGSNRQSDVRSWLGRVARNQARDQWRGEGRRRAREAAAVEGGRQAQAGPATPEQLIGDLEIHRLLAEVVTGLDEPYRSTLVLHYYEVIPAADIAQRLGIPASTVRWRLQEALERVRRELDRRHGGDRGRWHRALVPLVGFGGPVPRVAMPHAAVLGVGIGALAIVLGAVWYGGRPDQASLASDRAAATPADRVPLPALAPRRTATPRFEVTGAARPPESETPEQRQANDILKRMLAALVSDDYEAFLTDAGDAFKVASTPQLWRDMRAQLGAWLRDGFQAQPVGSRRRGNQLVFMFKLEFHDGSEDQLLQLAVEDGRVVGFLR